MADGWTHRDNGMLAKIMGRMTEIGRLPSMAATVGAIDTAATVRRVRPGANTDASRTAGEHIIAMRMNAKQYGRNVLSFTRHEMDEGTRIWATATAGIVRGAGGAADVLLRAAQDVAAFMVERVRVHIMSGYGAAGRLKPVLPSTDARKLRETGQVGLGPMRRTGQLARALKASARRLRR